MMQKAHIFDLKPEESDCIPDTPNQHRNQAKSQLKKKMRGSGAKDQDPETVKKQSVEIFAKGYLQKQNETESLEEEARTEKLLMVWCCGNG